MKWYEWETQKFPPQQFVPPVVTLELFRNITNQVQFSAGLRRVSLESSCPDALLLSESVGRSERESSAPQRRRVHMGNVPERHGLRRRRPGLTRGGRRGRVIVLEAMVLVSAEHHAAASGTGCAGGSSVSEGVRGQRRAGGHPAPHHVTEVAVCEARVRKRRRRPAEVRWPGRRRIVRLRRSRSVSRACRGRRSRFGLGGLPVVQVCAGRRFRRFWGSLVRRENGEWL